MGLDGLSGVNGIQNLYSTSEVQENKKEVKVETISFTTPAVENEQTNFALNKKQIRSIKKMDGGEKFLGDLAVLETKCSFQADKRLNLAKHKLEAGREKLIFEFLLKQPEGEEATFESAKKRLKKSKLDISENTLAQKYMERHEERKVTTFKDGAGNDTSIQVRWVEDEAGSGSISKLEIWEGEDVSKFDAKPTKVLSKSEDGKYFVEDSSEDSPRYYSYKVGTLSDVTEQVTRKLSNAEPATVKEPTTVIKVETEVKPTTDETPTEEVVTKPVITDETPAEEVVTKPVITDETPTEEVVTKPVITEETPAEEVVVKPVITEETPAEEVVTTPVITEETSTEEVVTTPVITEETSTEEVVTTPDVNEVISETAKQEPYVHNVSYGETWYGIVQDKYGVKTHSATMAIIKQLKLENNVNAKAINMPKNIKLLDTININGQEFKLDKDKELTKPDKHFFIKQPKENPVTSTEPDNKKIIEERNKRWEEAAKLPKIPEYDGTIESLRLDKTIKYPKFE